MNEWDFVKGVLIILVIWGHICAYTSGVSYEKNALTTYIRLFQMPAFIFVSGFFQKKISTIAQFVEVTKNNIISIGVPYVVWTVVYFVLYTVANAILKNEYNFSFKSIAASFAFLWFFGCLLFCQFLFGCISIVNEKMKWGGVLFGLSIAITFICPATILDIWHIPFLWPFYILGYVCKNIDYEKLIHDERYIILVGLLSIAVFVIAPRYETAWTFYNLGNCVFECDETLRWIVVLRYVLYAAATICTISILLRVYCLLINTKAVNSIVSIGRKTLFYYAAHVAILYTTFRTVINKLTNEEGILVRIECVRYYLVDVLIVAGVLLILRCLYRVFESDTATRLILLGRKNN